VVQFGDNCKLNKEAGSNARELTSNHTSARRTLFQDIFGKSAFNEVPAMSAPAVEIGKRPVGNEISDTFDSPAYLMPPLEHLFGAVIGAFLTPRGQDAYQSNSMEPNEPDVDMEEDPADLMVGGVIRPRVVDQAEMDAFIALFQTHSVTCMRFRLAS
jgi:NET1-associated nuclear protein 1 (U3 small nucleolar RNA-associated protein 17)